ncbi:MAG: winged helix-turn-helix transcriptional regulator [Solirubrobacterales bacterium]
MPRRSYEQYCPLACALDLIGERWTLLIVRDLIAGPKRYTDLRRGLPGLATDLLTERLRALEDAGVVRRRKLRPPAAATVYELTERGRELELAVFGLARFGFSLLGESPTSEDPPTPDRFALLLRVLFDPDQAPPQPETWVFGGGDRAVAVTVSQQGVELHVDPDEAPRPPSARFIGDVPTIYELVVGRLDTSAALADGRLRIEGDAGALHRMRAALPTPRSGAVAAA